MITNTSPLIFLTKIVRLELLRELFDTIIIPQAVYDEITIGEKPGSLEIKKAVMEGWIKINKTKIKNDYKLGKGENEAINLAMESNDCVIIDDKAAIRVLEALKIKHLRTTTIIFMALNKKLITKKEALRMINKLIAEGYYITPQVYTRILETLKK